MRNEPLHSCPELIDYINKTGFLPLLSMGITGWSAEEKMQSKKRICKCLLPNSIYRFLFILFLQNEHVLYFSNAFINSFFTVSTPGKPVCF